MDVFFYEESGDVKLIRDSMTLQIPNEDCEFSLATLVYNFSQH